MALPHVQQALAPHVPMLRYSAQPDEFASTRGHSPIDASPKESKPTPPQHLAPQPIDTAFASSQFEAKETQRSGTPWWMWFIFGANELLGKIPGYPSSTVGQWLQEHNPGARSGNAREAVVFQELNSSNTLREAYTTLKGMGYDDTSTRLRYLFRYMVRIRPLQQGSSWAVNADFLEALMHDGITLSTLDHESKVFQVEETARRILTPDEVIRQCEHIRSAIAEFTKIMHSAVEQSYAETQDRTQYLHRTLDQRTNQLIAKVLQRWHTHYTHSRSAPVHLDGFIVELNIAGLGDKVTPHGTRAPDALGHIAEALTRGATLTPMQHSIVEQLLTDNPSFRQYIDHHTADLSTSTTGRERAAELLRAAGLRSAEGLRTALFMASQHPGTRFGLEMPGAQRVSITWGTPGTGLGVHLHAESTSDHVRSPFHFQRASVFRIDRHQALAVEPAIALLGRNAEVQYITKSDLVHLESLAASAARAPAHSQEVGRVLHRTVQDVQAAWLSLYDKPPHAKQYAAQVYERAELIARTNWGFTLLQQIDALTRKLSAYAHSITDATHGEAKQYLRTMVEIHLGTVEQQFRTHFREHSAKKFTASIHRLGEYLVTDRAAVAREQATLVRLTMREMRHQTQSVAPHLWPPIRSAQLSHECSVLRALSPEQLARGELTQETRQLIGRLAGERANHDKKPSIQRARQLFNGGSTERALTELYRIMHRVDSGATKRMHAAALLARISARQGQWGQVDFALHEMAQLVIMGQNITPKSRALLTDIAKDPKVPAVKGVIPVRIPVELLPELGPALAALPKRAHHFLSRIEQGAIAEVSLPILPNQLASLPDPWARWERLPAGLQAQLLESIHSDLRQGARAPVEVLKIIAVLDAHEFPRWMEILYGSNAELHLRETLRLERYRARYFSMIKQVLKQHHIDPHTIIVDTQARTPRKSITGDLIRPQLPPAPESQLWTPPSTARERFMRQLPSYTKQAARLGVEIGGPASVSGLVFIGSKQVIQHALDLPDSSTGQVLYGLNILGLAHVADASLQGAGRAWLHWRHPSLPAPVVTKLSPRRLFGSMGLGFLQWRFYAGTSIALGADYDTAEYIGLGATGVTHGASQAAMRRFAPGAYDLLHNPTIQRLAEVPGGRWIGTSTDELALSVSRGLQRGGLAYLAFDMLISLGGSAYEDLALEPVERFVRRSRHARRSAQMRSHSFFGSAETPLITRSANTVATFFDQFIPEQAHMIIDDLWNSAAQNQEEAHVRAQAAAEHYREQLYPAAVHMMTLSTEQLVHDLLHAITTELDSPYPAPLRTVIAQTLSTHAGNAQSADFHRQWQQFTARHLKKDDYHWLFAHHYIDAGTLDPQASDAALFWLQHHLVAALNTGQQRLQEQYLQTGQRQDQLRLEALSRYQLSLNAAVTRFDQARATLEPQPWAHQPSPPPTASP